MHPVLPVHLGNKDEMLTTESTLVQLRGLWTSGTVSDPR